MKDAPVSLASPSHRRVGYDTGYTDKSFHSTTPSPYGWPPASQPHATCRVPSCACEQRWTLGMVAVVKVAAVHLQLAAATGPVPTTMPCLGMQYFSMKDLLIGGRMSFVGVTGIP